ncbi:MAG: 1-acyl-sn-glycerol-3-phosphate acyltransferase [Proteobacteria bacterium]|nr:1-acyl-sn-glycerol-3-phosphate acyltransferase [Pseudomonadota bacterium]
MKLEVRKKPLFGEHKYSPKKLIKELINHPDIEKVLQEHPPKKTFGSNPKKYVQEILKEIVATPSPAVVEGLRRSLRMLWYRIFNGLEIQGLEELKAQIGGKQLVYLPSHRSHLDYLLLSYVLDEHYMEIPHIIAGNNLNVTGVGKILKGGGAVFMRRVFRNQPVYATAFITYLYYLLDHRFPIELFIEGGRSRTGKNLLPKIGLLSMLLEYLIKNQEKDLYFVPVSFTYERVPEEGAYIKELNGAEKQQENLLEMINAFKVLKKNFGKVYVSFAPPMSVRDMIARYLDKNKLDQIPDPDSEDFRELSFSLGMEVMDQINIYTRTSAVPVVATALLSERHRGFQKNELLEKSRFLVDLYQAVHPRAVDTLVESEGGLEGIVEFLIQSGTVGCIHDPDEDIYYFDTKDKIRLNLYKNIFVHHYVIPSIIALKLKHGVKTRDKLLESIFLFNDLLRYEFRFPQSYDFTEAVDTMLKFALEQDLVTEKKGVYSINPNNQKKINMLANILLPFLESFYVAINVLTSKKAAFPMDSKNLIEVFRETHHKLLLLGKIDSLEGNLTVSYNNIIRFFTEEEILSVSESGKRKKLIKKGEEFENIHALNERFFPSESELISAGEW